MLRLINAKFDSTCGQCAGYITEGEPILWEPGRKAMHEDVQTCIEYARLADADQAVQKETIGQPVIPDGYYTLVYGGNGEYATFRIRESKYEGRNKGRQMIARLTGPDNTSSYTNFAWIDNRSRTVLPFRTDVGEMAITNGWDRLANILLGSNMEEAGYAYALKSGNCYRCGRVLTVESSVKRGLGPICADKV
jgi:hypothetical protein